MLSGLFILAGFLSLAVAIWFDAHYRPLHSTAAGLLGAMLILASMALAPAHARDDGRYAQSPLEAVV